MHPSQHPAPLHQRLPSLQNVRVMPSSLAEAFRSSQRSAVASVFAPGLSGTAPQATILAVAAARANAAAGQPADVVPPAPHASSPALGHLYPIRESPDPPTSLNGLSAKTLIYPESSVEDVGMGCFRLFPPLFEEIRRYLRFRPV